VSFQDRQFEWNVTPAGFLGQIGLKFKAKKEFLALEFCPFCKGGDHNDKGTCIVHATDGNYTCCRASCGERGSFWKLIESQGLDPRDFRGEGVFTPRKNKVKKTGYIAKNKRRY
jgi:hypothetical protein